MRLANLNVGEVVVRYQPVAERKTGGLLAALAVWRERARQRAELAQLDYAQRRDIGITEADIWRETRKYPWQD